MLLCTFSRLRQPSPGISKIIKLKVYLHIESREKGICLSDYLLTSKRALAIDVCLTILCLCHGNAKMLIGIPYNHTPMPPECVERGTIVEKYRFYHLANSLHIFS